MTCEKCGHVLEVGDFPFCKGEPWQHARGYTSVVGDECDFVQHNGTKTPIRFRSKLEFRRWCKEHNYRVQDTHVGEQGSDKSSHTTPWQAGGTQWLRDAEILATRHGNFAGNEPPEKPFHIRWTSGDMTGKDLAHYRDQST